MPKLNEEKIATAIKNLLDDYDERPADRAHVAEVIAHFIRAAARGHEGEAMGRLEASDVFGHWSNTRKLELLNRLSEERVAAQIARRRAKEPANTNNPAA